MSWPLVKLGDLFKVTSGGTPSRKKPEYYDGGDIHWVKTGDLHNKYVRTASEFITQEGLDGSSARRYPKGTVLVAMYGATIGACSILDIEAATNQACAAFTPTEKVDPVFLYYLLKHSKPAFVKAGSGGAQPNISGTFLKNFEIPLPPIDEQKRIAAILDKADAIRQKRKQTIDLADEFLRSVFLDMFGDPVTNPKGWDVKRLEELISEGDKLNYGVVQPGDDDENGVPLVRSGDLYDSGTPLSKVRRVSSSVDEKHRKSRLKGNEILIACVGSIGKVGWVDESMIGWNIARAVTRIPLRDSVNREYIFRYLQSPVIQGYFQKETRAVAQPTLNVGLISKTPIALPPQEQQDEFLKVHNKVNRFKQNAIVKSKHMDELFKSLSQKAFSGQL
ncbi:TPA: restriction endonuclease subunit S [Vibrio vulnificus]|nr:restriction endonuclease subunit S [Vibrio vulnificus]HAS6170096.1 restriction endonuclease subunit S [Vibrio vulnificus]HAS6385193.1 restriction endonuclease subunit S [Vibrio vulnificus]HAS6387204.1 restriction endonuclease subunit S [Vibrio vulnificus]HDY7624709.1 restriction endonuclease subunit S [Vibrio vulnificus]